MPKRIAVTTIIFHRGGQRIRIPAGKQFEFTTEELEQLKKDSPNAIRTPKNETETVQEVKAPEAPKGNGGKKNQGGKNQPKADEKPDGAGGDDGAGAGGDDGDDGL